MQKLNNLKNRVLSKQGKQTSLTRIFDMVRNFNCMGELLGRTFEVRDAKGSLVYSIIQKPITLVQLKTLMKEYELLKKEDIEIIKKMNGVNRVKK